MSVNLRVDPAAVALRVTAGVSLCGVAFVVVHQSSRRDASSIARNTLPESWLRVAAITAVKPDVQKMTAMIDSYSVRSTLAPVRGTRLRDAERTERQHHGDHDHEYREPPDWRSTASSDLRSTASS